MFFIFLVFLCCLSYLIEILRLILFFYSFIFFIDSFSHFVFHFYIHFLFSLFLLFHVFLLFFLVMEKCLNVTLLVSLLMSLAVTNLLFGIIRATYAMHLLFLSSVYLFVVFFSYSNLYSISFFPLYFSYVLELHESV